MTSLGTRHVCTDIQAGKTSASTDLTFTWRRMFMKSLLSLFVGYFFFFFSSAETNPKSLGLLSSISAMGQGAQALGCFGKCMDSCSSNTNVGGEMPAPHPRCSAVWVLKTPQKPQVSASCESVLPSVLPEWPYIYTNGFEYAFLPPRPSKISILYTIFCTLLFSVRSSRTF